MAKAIICPHCGSSRLDIKDSQTLYQCRDCDAYVDTKTFADKAVSGISNLISGTTKLGLLILAIDDADTVIDLIEDIVD
ncbi:MAG: hypothetical protein AAGE96_22025 [Cyanobacteria bacterium P01_G01_bin.19]